ncbi:MAG: DUF1292 domain-containing protein [Lachnospiraceae bacterium]|jgi:hypothetical protein|nr:DUF1292 domain-containing protein [Lachnospiraceae bacterium]
MKDETIVLSTDSGEQVAFDVLEVTRFQGADYLLVADSSLSGDGECYILKDTSPAGDEQAAYEFVENEAERDYLYQIFTELLSDTDIALEK